MTEAEWTIFQTNQVKFGGVQSASASSLQFNISMDASKCLLFFTFSMPFQAVVCIFLYITLREDLNNKLHL